MPGSSSLLSLSILLIHLLLEPRRSRGEDCGIEEPDPADYGDHGTRYIRQGAAEVPQHLIDDIEKLGTYVFSVPPVHPLIPSGI